MTTHACFSETRPAIQLQLIHCVNYWAGADQAGADWEGADWAGADQAGVNWAGGDWTEAVWVGEDQTGATVNDNSYILSLITMIQNIILLIFYYKKIIFDYFQYNYI